MKKLLSIILLIVSCCIFFVGCTNKENTETTTTTNGSGASSLTESTTTQQTQLPQKHTVSLTMNNYSTYIETSFVVSNTATGALKTVFTASGCLSYAYYENVVFEIEHDGEKMLVACNATGNGSGSYGGRNLGTITAISGTVIYWM